MIICANLWTKKLSAKESRELAQASRNHEVPWRISIRSQKPWLWKSCGFPCLKNHQWHPHTSIRRGAEGEVEPLLWRQRKGRGSFRKKLFSAVNWTEYSVYNWLLDSVINWLLDSDGKWMRYSAGKWMRQSVRKWLRHLYHPKCKRGFFYLTRPLLLGEVPHPLLNPPLLRRWGLNR